MYTHNQTIDAWIHGPWIWLYDTPKHAEGPLMFVVLWRGSFTKFRGPGHPPNKMCNATAKQRFISVAAKNGGIQKSRSPNKHNVPSNALSASPRKTVASKSLGHPTNKMCNANTKQRFISVAIASKGCSYAGAARPLGIECPPEIKCTSRPHSHETLAWHPLLLELRALRW